MYFILGILLCIFIIGVILLNLVKIILKQNEEPYKKLFNIALYIIALTTLFNIIIATFSFFDTKDKVALVGDKGMKGPKGKKGGKAICDSKCGQKVCYVRVVEHANIYFSKRMNMFFNQQQSSLTSASTLNDVNYEIKNEEFKDLINKICSSDKYYNILTQKNKSKKINEDKLIKYLESIIEEWIDKFIEYNPDNRDDIMDFLGVKYLMDKYLRFDDIINTETPDVINPLNFIQKYDVYSWAGNNETTKLKINIISQDLEMPKPKEPRLYIMKTNNYKFVYDTKSKKNIWDTTHCRYNQMGDDASNPNNINTCIYLNPNSKLKEYRSTWKRISYSAADDLTIYNPRIFKNSNNQIFYPVGSVWTRALDVKKSDYKTRTPKSKNYCGEGHGEERDENHSNIGPDKETILVSGDVVDPKSFKLLWDSKRGCVGCQEDNNAVKIYRPIPPEGYVALGDVAVKHNENVRNLKIKCVPKECVKKMSLGPMVWNNKKAEFMKFNNYLKYTQKKPYFYKKPTSCSLWSSGSSDVFRENRNNPDFDLSDDGGYNLFIAHAGKGFNTFPKNIFAYKIIHKYTQFANGFKPKDLELKIPKGVNPNPQRYNHDIFFGIKPQNAVLRNESILENNTNSSIKDINGDKKRLYMIDDLNKRANGVNDSYFLKTYSDKKKDYSACLVYTESGEAIRTTDSCDNKNEYHLWNIKHNKGTNENHINANVNLVSKVKFTSQDSASHQRRCLTHYYDELGKSNFKLVDCGVENSEDGHVDNGLHTNYKFKYSTISEAKMPIYDDNNK